MESLKRKRTQQRREFTLAADIYEKAYLSKEVDAISDAFFTLSDVADSLFATEVLIRDLWCQDENFVENLFQLDQDKALEYKQRWSHVRNKHNKITKYSKTDTNSLVSAESANNSNEKKLLINNKNAELRFPKLELPKFDGNIKNWLSFWGQFQKIHNDENIENTDKFQYLLQSMVVNTNARQLVETYPPSGGNYIKAVEALKARFARDDILIECYVRGLLNLVLLQQRGQNKDLPALYDNLQMHLQALETLGVVKDKYTSVLFPMIESALPEEVLRTWNRIRSKSNKEEDLSKLIQFLKEEVESEERIQIAKQGFLQSTSETDTKTPTACFVSESKKYVKKGSTIMTCLWCAKDSHVSSECHKAARMSQHERLEFVKGKKACQICLKTNHVTKKCRSSVKCLFCKRRHMTIMCPDISEQGPSNKKEYSTSLVQSNHNEKSGNLLCQLKSTTLLQTLIVKVQNNNKEIHVRVLLDSGAQRSYIKGDIAQLLNLKPITTESIGHCLFGGFETNTEEHNVYQIYIKSVSNEFCMTLSVLEQKNICDFLPKVRSNVILEKLQEKGIVLTETMGSPDDIGILIGADFSGLILTGTVMQLDNNLTAIYTKLGWTLQGPVTGVYSSVARMTTNVQCLSKIDLNDLWSLETLGIRDPCEHTTKEAHEKEILDSFNSSILINDEGRYEVRLLWRDNMPRPQPNYDIARKRLMSNTSRLETLGKTSDYDLVFKEWLNLNIIEEAPNPNSKHGVYMPHHAIIKESSQTTKIRPVFDASVKDIYGMSLNACLEKGSNLIELIPELLIDFRREAFGITADIAKAFLQIAIAPEDRDYLKFLWWADVNEKDKGIITYRHRRVVFGVTSSPFHLTATIAYHLDNSSKNMKETASKLKKSFYVDNCVTSVNSKESMYKFITEAKQLMLDGKFDLRSWVTAPERVDENVETVSVLGVVWNAKDDDLSCTVSPIISLGDKVTKRTILSISQKIFDPIGVLCPSTIITKMIIQKLWVMKIGWDEDLPEHLNKEINTWAKYLHLIPEIKIPRRLNFLDSDRCQNSIHVFCDASQCAYATCIFFRSEFQENVNISLVLAKSRVTPLKEITIPRLELIAAVLATRLSKTVINSLNLPNCPVYYWTDSSVVLSWITGDCEWSVFVTNRVREIRKATAKENWRHISGNMNPADLPSRGISIKGLLESRWWEGPSWLRLPSQSWPVSDFVSDINQVNAERKRGISHSAQAMLVSENDFLSCLAYFSTYIKIVRMVSWILRLRFKANRKCQELTYDEIVYAEKVLFRAIQSNYPKLLSKLHTFTDNEGIIRLQTKLNLGNEEFNFKCPVVLPSCERIVQRLVEDRHKVLQHAGTQTLMTNLRNTLWIIGIRKLAKRVINECVICKRFKAKRCHTPLANLPADRTEGTTAFEVTGVDLAGPLILRSTNKCWIVLFTCATYRAVHFEVVESLSTHDFILALRRFIARRGRVRCIYSDNGTNFTGLNNSFNSLNWNDVLCFSSIARIKWNFIPPGAPWWGGFYERLVGVLKQILRRVLRRASVTLVELQTVLCDCEATINNRPLTYLSNQPDELKPLTPSMFLQPIVECTVTDLDQLDGKSINMRAQYCQTLRDNLRQRFRNEYLSNLIQRGKQFKVREFRAGDIVLIETDDKRINWPLGIIVDVYVGNDGYSRVAKVRTSKGFKVRPFQRLFPLELYHESINDSLLTKKSTFNMDTDVPEAKNTRPQRVVQVPKKFNDFLFF